MLLMPLGGVVAGSRFVGLGPSGFSSVQTLVMLGIVIAFLFAITPTDWWKL